jgi:hypothetical protein
MIIPGLWRVTELNFTDFVCAFFVREPETASPKKLALATALGV